MFESPPSQAVQIKWLLREQEALRNGLKRFGHHLDPDCRYPLGCQCGLDELLCEITIPTHFQEVGDKLPNPRSEANYE